MKKITVLFIAVALLLPAAAFASEETPAPPHWSIEIKGGRFAPALPDFRQFYGKSYMGRFSGSLAYKITRQVDIGVGAGTMRAKGQAHAPLHGILAGDVTYELYPLNVFILARGVISEKQWLVPYAGGGYTRMFYRQNVKDQGKVRGAADGYHARAGLQFLIDGIDRNAADKLAMDFGVSHTSLFFEAEYSHAVARRDAVNLGGTSYLGGLLFEF